MTCGLREGVALLCRELVVALREGSSERTRVLNTGFNVLFILFQLSTTNYIINL